MKSNKPALNFIFITLLLDVLGFGLLIPVAPSLVQSLIDNGTGTLGGTEDQAASYYGWLIVTYAAMQFVFGPVLGALSDKVGRRPVLLFSIFGSGLDYFAMAFSPTLSFLFITRAINGLTGASITVCNAYVADVTPPDQRARAYGMVGAAFGIGFVVGPVMGGVLGEINLHLPFYVAGGISLLNWLYGFFVLPESLPPEKRGRFSLRNANPLGALHKLSEYPLVARLAGSLFMLNLAMFGLHATWVLYTAHRYGWSKTQVGLSLTIVGIGAAIVQGGLARKIIPALGAGVVGERRALVLGIAIGVLAYLGYAFATEGWMIYATIAIASLGGIAGPAGQALITRSVKPTEQGAVQGALTSLQSVANILGPLIGTTVFAYAISKKGSSLDMPGLSFVVCAGLSAIGGLLAWHATNAATRQHDAQALLGANKP